MTKVATGLRVEEQTMRDLAELAALMSARAGGVEVTPLEAARVALTRGIAILRAELGAPAQKGGKRPARKPAK